MLNFTPPPSDRKRKRDKDDDAGIADDEKEVSRAARMTLVNVILSCLT